MRLAVFFNDSPADATVLRFARRAADVAQAEKILCIHFREKGIADKRADPAPEEFEARMREGFTPEMADRLVTQVVEASGARAILKTIRDLEPSLVIVGRRLPSDQMSIGSTFSRLARKAPCHVLVVTEFSEPHFERFLIPVDFSEHSNLAIEAARSIIRLAGCDRPQILLQHNVEVDYGYRYTGKTFEEYAEGLRQNAEEQMSDFVAGTDLGGIDVKTVITLSASPVEAVVALAVARKMDVVMVGSRGRDTMFGALLGSTAEKIIAVCPLPVMVVKRRGEATELLNAILKAG